ncbi:MFS transporter [Sporolactobacillus shoreicorticis]|uniref:MFS transporter n=1 Tax=Sporolactobacillus shoreicorticis TaxID=1923877 RepID=A0ABW5SAF3_9BACL|nr:MFS transporter [Sporolactobacillus shoreicorticis]MCO7128248.1 MFS transporter [Sporolactobacillus shoreicorticis]
MNIEKRYSFFLGNVLCSYSFIDMIYGAAYIILMNQNHLNAFEISTVMAISSISLAIFDYPSGNLADIFGRKKITSIGFIIWGVGLIGFALSKNVISFSLFTLISSAGIALISGSPQAWYIDKLKEINKDSYKNRVVPILNGIISIFAAAGAMLASISNLFNVSLAIIIAGLTAIIVALVVSAFFSDNYGERLEHYFVKEIVTSTKNFFKDGTMIHLLGYYLIDSMPLTAFLLVWQLYAINVIKIKNEWIGIMLVIFMLVQALASFFSGIVVKKISNFNLTIYGEILSAISLFLIFTAKSNILLYFFLILVFEFGLQLIQTNKSVWMQDLIKSEKRSTYTSAITAINSGVGFVLTLIFGMLIEQLGYKVIWLLAGISQFIALLYILIFIKKILIKKVDNQNVRY